MGMLGAGGIVIGMISLIGGTKAACRKYLRGRGKACCYNCEECNL